MTNGITRHGAGMGEGKALGRRPALRGALLAGLGLVAAPALIGRARAAESWPRRPVRIIVPFSAGSTPDVTARVVAEGYRTAFGEPCVVENRLGANGTIGMNLVARADDGHTFGVFTNGVATATALYPNLSFDPSKDFAFLSLLTRAPQVLVVRSTLPIQDFEGFVAYAKANPGALSFGSVGIGASSHLAMEELGERFEIELVHAPYPGLPPAKVDLIAGRTQAMLATAASLLPEIQEGHVRAIAIASDRRYPKLPDVPTFAEVGVEDAESYAWNGLVAPRSTPPEVAERLVAEARAALDDPKGRGPLEAAGFEVVGSSPEEFTSIVAAETERWGGLLRRLGLTAG